jgi:DNA-binding beta-propeller fold protein YncE/tRNA A-37 threonylcarbamoyl transferase component Bud32
VSDQGPPAFREFAIGSRIAGYRLEEQIGRGGMAVVYRAYEARLDRNVALKILAPGLARDDAFRRRFIRESRIAAAVDHPNIIPVFDAGEADGVLFIAMRFVHGLDVRTLLDAEGPLPAGRATDIIAQVASALDAAHARGLVHRDVKPANILLDAAAGSGRQDHVYLSDFGLGKQTLADLGQTGLTAHGEFLGTLDYIAPEQVESRHVDGRADLYALACTAFELLSGAPPFRSDGPGMAVIWAKLSEPAPLLSTRRAGLPGAADDVMTRALAREPAGRFGSCGEFAAALRDACGLGPAVPEPAVPEPAAPPPREATQVAIPPASAVPAPAGPGLTEPLPHEPPDPADADEAAGLYRGARGRADADEAAGLYRGARGRADPYDPASLYREPPAPGGASGAGPPGGYASVVLPAPGRPWWRTRAFMSSTAAVIVVGVAAVSFTALHGLTGNGGTGGGLAVRPPGCTAAAASAPVLSHARSQTVALGGSPFGVAVSPGGGYSFVALGNAIAVLSNNGGAQAPAPVATVPAPGAGKTEAVTGNGQYLLAVAGSGAYVISVARAEDGSGPGAVLGTLAGPPGNPANEVSVSPDGGFAFITFQNDGDVAVFNLAQAAAGGFGHSGFVGLIKLGAGSEPQGMAASPGGRWLYVTGESQDGRLYVIDMRKAETDPRHAVQSSAAAGCAPARVIVSADGADVWVTDRDSNALVAFSAAKLLTDPAQSLIARVSMGQTPIGLSFVDGSKAIMVADANTRGLPRADNLALVSTELALRGSSGALRGFITAGRVPRELALEPGGHTLLSTDNGSGQLQAIDTGSLP